VRLYILDPSLFEQVLLGASLGIGAPQAFDWFHSGYFTTSLGFLMLSMGLTLTINDFKEVHSHLICFPHVKY
jgi:predicted Na+-dependent transporter